MPVILRPSHRGYILAAMAALVLPIAIFVPKGLAVLFPLAALLLLVAKVSGGWRMPFAVNGLVKILAGFVLFAAISAVWSITPETTFYKALTMLLVLAAGLVLVGGAHSLDEDQRQILETALRWGGIIGFALLGIEIFGGAKITTFLRALVGKDLINEIHTFQLLNVGTTVAALYIWPWAVVVWRKWSWGVALILTTAAAGVLFGSEADAPSLGLVAGGLVAVLVFATPKIAPVGLALVLVVGVVSAPALPNLILSAIDTDGKPRFVSYSGYHRLMIWKATTDKIAERPILGYGFDTSRAMYNESQKILITKNDKDGERWWSVFSEPIPLHPHSTVLQVWLELGAAGAMILLAAFLAMVRAIQLNASSRVTRAACFGGFISVMAVASISFGAWQGWWLAAQWLIAALMTATTLSPVAGKNAKP